MTSATESVLEGGRAAAERVSDGTVYRYVYAPDGPPLAVDHTSVGAAAELFSYHTDAQGSVVAITNPSGSVVARYRYDAFGAVTSVTGSDPIAARNPLRYRVC
ncbi:MAG TPA: RHS repeat domain-containing protein [Coriobacteriia bacterium]|nr:RHS repeat domain-containing protein [Coriobacteriia bacterium]